MQVERVQMLWTPMGHSLHRSLRVPAGRVLGASCSALRSFSLVEGWQGAVWLFLVKDGALRARGARMDQ